MLTYQIILKPDKSLYQKGYKVNEVIEVNSRDPKSLFIHLNEIMYKQKENPIS